MKYPIYETGGYLRDDYIKAIHGIDRPHKDVDIAVEAPSFEDLQAWCIGEDFKIHDIHEEFLTVRCGIPDGHRFRDWGRDLDVTLCRIDGPYTDGRHPDWTKPGTIWEDLARRDARCNSIARNIETGEILDPNNGVQDITDKIIRTVGDPMERWREDGLRILRHFRQAVELLFEIDWRITEAMTLNRWEVRDLIARVKKERRYVELHKMLVANQHLTMQMLGGVLLPYLEAILSDGLRIDATLKER